MVKFDHMMLPVCDCVVSRDWYVQNLGFKVEFENIGTGTVAIQDDDDFTIFLQNTTARLAGEKCSLTIQVKDVDQAHQHLLENGVRFLHPPKRHFWGYGAELADPDGYVIRLWDEVSMREKGSA
ncbi:MAG TPA: VOC family protein [Candidatus Acidoferrales bacterium]|nr:VOC family protein [Candidatus Acidoferrales bacterium]